MREAIIHVRDSDLAALGLDSEITALRAAGVRDVTELNSDGVVQVHVDDPIPDEELADLDCVEWWEAVAESATGATYLWQLQVPACESACPLAEHSTAYEVVAVRERGFDLSIIGTQADLSQAIDQLAAVGMHVDLERLAEYRGPATTLDHLTARQQEVIRTAYALGYYDVPRETSTEGVAEALDLDPSTVSEHLQRAEQNLVDDILIPAE